MSMTLDKAAKWIKDLRDRYSKKAEEYEAQGALIPMDALYPYIQALGLALTALRGPTREQAERMRGEWQSLHRLSEYYCSRCGEEFEIHSYDKDKYQFCPHCMAPMTDEAVDMTLERWKEALENA